MLLLDTHALVWMDADDAALGPQARQAIRQAWSVGEVAVSAISFWEVAMLAQQAQKARLIAARLAKTQYQRALRAVIMADGRLVTSEDLDLDLNGGEETLLLNLKSAREQADRKVIRHALARSEGNISNAARLLGVSRPTLYDLLKQYDMQA